MGDEPIRRVALSRQSAFSHQQHQFTEITTQEVKENLQTWHREHTAAETGQSLKFYIKEFILI